FREAFIRRYEGIEVRRVVPLAEVLDPELGLGFGPSTGHDGGTTLLEGIDFPTGTDERSVRWGPRHTFLFDKLSEALAIGAGEIMLDDADVGRLASAEALPLPDAFSVSAVLVAPSPEALARGELRVLLEGVAGPSGARLLGRFCHGDAALSERVQAHLR